MRGAEATIVSPAHPIDGRNHGITPAGIHAT